MIVPSVVGDMHMLTSEDGGRPFTVGQIDPAKGFVHVFDDTTLGIVTRTLDTISDFVGYLEKKERLILSGRLAAAAGEDDLLAFYLKNIGPDGEHDFLVPAKFKSIAVDEGFWNVFQSRPERIAQIEANEISYAWDALIENFSYHIFAGTLHYTLDSSLAHQERIFRFMAREPRTRRRLLARFLLELIEKTPQNVRATRVVLPSKPGDPYYLFLVLPEIIEESYEEYREIRRKLLGSYCAITRLEFPDAERVIGIATESGRGAGGSEDFVLFDGANWTDEDQVRWSETKATMIELGLLGERTLRNGIEKEFPAPTIGKHSKDDQPMKGRNRNEPCPCGSGKKVKKCHGQT